MPDALTSTLDQIGERNRTASTYDDWRQVGRDGRALLAAIGVALEPHQPGARTVLGALCKRHENHRYFSVTSTEADDVRACPDCTAAVWTSCAGCGGGVPADECPVREAITRELTKGEGAP
jgi:hypothetical protein